MMPAISNLQSALHPDILSKERRRTMGINVLRWGFPKIRGSVSWVPVIIVEFWDLLYGDGASGIQAPRSSRHNKFVGIPRIQSPCGLTLHHELGD